MLGPYYERHAQQLTPLPTYLPTNRSSTERTNERTALPRRPTPFFPIQKWGADFPNTGFWTYIKYTIVEQHVYDEAELRELTWAQSASIAFGFFQMVGFNRYQSTVSTLDAAGVALEKPVDFIEVLQRLGKWKQPSSQPSTTQTKQRATNSSSTYGH